jgi:tetraacyldisaccharide 4'-kinase
VVDAQRGIGNGRVMPAGPLRAPLGVQLARAHAVLLVGAGRGGEPVAQAARDRGLPVFHGRLVPDDATLASLHGAKVLAFAGIGNPDKFFAALAEAGIDVRTRIPFPDHHRFGAAEARELQARAGREGLLLVTTEKDLARMAGEPELAALAATVCALPVSLAVDEADAFRNLVLARTA